MVEFSHLGDYIIFGCALDGISPRRWGSAAPTSGVMKTVKLMICAAAVALAAPVIAGGEGWTADFEAAKKEAAGSGKDLLVDFTGSDWCGWCIKLNKEVFQHDEFKTGVKDGFVLVELDFPKDKSKIPAETLEQNKALGKKYGVRGYPTILLLDAEGRPYAKTGYRKGGPEAYVTHLNELKASRVARDEAFKKADQSEGIEKAKALVAALSSIKVDDSMISKFYAETVAKIKELDPEDQTGYVKKGQLKERFMEFQKGFQGFARKKDWDGAMGLIDDTLESGDFKGDDAFGIKIMRVIVFAEQGKFDDAIRTLDEVNKAHPTNPMGAQVDQLRKQLEAGAAKAAAQ